jgi:hypothetical protein
MKKIFYVQAGTPGVRGSDRFVEVTVTESDLRKSDYGDWEKAALRKACSSWEDGAIIDRQTYLEARGLLPS